MVRRWRLLSVAHNNLGLFAFSCAINSIVLDMLRQTRLADFSRHRTEEDMELAQLGALKTLLREVLASARNSSAAAANAQCAANAATAAVEAVAALRKAIDTLLQAAPPSAATAAAAPGTAIRYKAGGGSRPHSSCERPLSRLTREEGAPDRQCRAEDWGKHDSVFVTTHLLSLQATSLGAGSSTGFSAASKTTLSAPGIVPGDASVTVSDNCWGDDVLASAATFTGAEAQQDFPGQNANGSQNASALANLDRSEAIAEETGLAVRLESARLSPNSSWLDAGPKESGATEAELGLLLAAAMRPVRGELKRLRAVMFDVRSCLDRDHVCFSALARSASPPPPRSLLHWPYAKPSPLQHYRRRAAAQPTTADPINLQSPHRRRIRLAGGGGGAALLGRAPCHSPSMPGGQGVQVAAAAGGAAPES